MTCVLYRHENALLLTIATIMLLRPCILARSAVHWMFVHRQVMAGDGEGLQDPQEMPIPEQFISSFQGGKLVTVAASHSGA